MDLTNINSLKQTLKDNRLWAKKSFGQNFLVAKDPLDQMMKSANIRDDEVVVEIGPGLGVLTEELAQRAKLVLAIEKDYHFVEYLRKRFKNQKNIKIIHQDILTYDLGSIAGDYKVVANLPYNIISPVIRKFLESSDNSRSGQFALPHTPYTSTPNLLVLMVQKEVAQRICAKPGDSNRGILTVMVEFYSQPEIVEIVDRSCFWPVPSVDSAIIKLKIVNCKLKIDPKVFFRVVKAGFSQKRRQIHNPLIATLHLEKPQIYDILEKANINPKLRAEDLSLDDWIRLYRQINKLT